MPLNDDFLKMVVFLLDEEGGTPTGTGFLVNVHHRGISDHTYLVTAKHVIDHEIHTFMRFRTATGTIHDHPLEQWEFDDYEDLAVQAVDFAPIEPKAVYFAYDLDDAIDRNHLPNDDRLLGEQIYFIGILERLKESMGSTMIPMVRSGTVGTLNQPNVPLENGTTVTAHLIDGRSLSGFSGSPCFVYRTNIANEPEGAIMQVSTRLLGIVVAHFDDLKDVSGELPKKLNTGVIAVLPVERLRELLERHDIVQARQDALERYLRNHPELSAQYQLEGD